MIISSKMYEASLLECQGTICWECSSVVWGDGCIVHVSWVAAP
jgi:hypothetical protein